MATIYYEYFDVAPASEQLSVGGRVFYFNYLPALREQGVLMAGVSRLREHHHVERIEAPFHVLLFSLEGQGEIIDGEDILPCGPGQLLLLPARGRRGFRLNGGEWRLAWFLLENTEQWAFLNGPATRRLDTATAESLYHAIAALHHEANLPRGGLTGGGVRQVLDLLQRELAPLNASQQPDLQRELHALLADIHANPTRPWTVALLAAQLGVSVATLSRLCQRHYHASPQQLIINERMARARELLLAGQGNVADVAEATGYLEVASFCRRFARHFGVPPGRLLRGMRS
ncbi:helix-turn-helix transcriptional regulator [Chitinilyticum litopenaei]|uniref:helix-turn-helix transcriptional regulator n=1 Tax=Chitinilyticum litopenaei TaxID=1121276 RepID=UPI000429CF5E|nr:AraC family transcriptional regulator [Chitinilyticum litopenaei]